MVIAMKVSRDNFGSKLQQLRESRNISVAELSRATDICRRTIHDWEYGKRFPVNMERINILAQYFKVSPVYFLESETHDELLQNPTIKNILNRISMLEHQLKAREERMPT